MVMLISSLIICLSWCGLTDTSTVSTVSSHKELCAEIIAMGKKVQDLSERVAKLDNGKVHTLTAADEELLEECGIQKEQTEENMSNNCTPTLPWYYLSLFKGSINVIEPILTKVFFRNFI